MSSFRHGLPSRPNAAAGPSQARPPQRPHRDHAGGQSHNAYQPMQQHFQVPPYQPGIPAQPSVYPYPQANMFAGYQPPYQNSPSFPNYGYSQAQYIPQMPMSMPPQNFGRSLFHQPQATPEGYSYSPTYLQHQTPSASENQHAHAAPIRPPAAKRPRTSATTTMKGVGAWRNCSHPGCKFVGPSEDVEVHEGDRHLIFPKGAKVEMSEEEERFARQHKGPAPPVFGTSITLHTEEDIAKWIAQRKAKFPSKERIAQKETELEAAIARGELPRGGRGRGRGGGGGFNRRNDPASMAEDWGRTYDKPNDANPTRHGGREQENGNAERGRGRGRGRGTDRGRGRGRGRGGSGGGGGAVDAGHHGAPDAVQTAPLKRQRPASPAVDGSSDAEQVNNGPITGLTSYESQESSDGSSDSESSDSSSESESDDSASSVNTDAPVASDAKPKGQPPSPIISAASPVQSKKMCRTFARTGRCSLDSKCQFQHNQPVQQQSQAIRDPQPQSNASRKVNAFERPSMLGALLANPIQNTLSQLSQTIRFLVANNMLEGVELYPGEAEERERKRKAVEVVPAVAEDAASSDPLEQEQEAHSEAVSPPV